MSTPQAKYPDSRSLERVPAVERAFDLLELLASSGRELTLSELSRRLAIPKSSTHYLVSTLVSRGFLQRGKDGHHLSLGYRISEFSRGFNTESQLRTISRPYMVALSRKLDMTAILNVLIGSEGITILVVESSQDDGIGGAWVGVHSGVHCTAQGKALIAYHSDKELEKLLGKRKLAIFTPKTIAILDGLKAALRDVRIKGYATNDEEFVPGARAVAAPIFDSTGTVMAALSVRALASRMPVSSLDYFGKEVASAAREISRRLSEVVTNDSEPEELRPVGGESPNLGR
jgi:DNA-binding IclR family transcriptional regulator